MSFLQNLHWRYATRRFDTEKKITEENIQKVLEAIQFTPTSTNIQPYQFYVITNQELKDEIQKVSWNQKQIGTSSHLLIFVARTDVRETKNELLEMMSGGNQERKEQLSGYEKMIDSLIHGLEKEDAVLEWSARQLYIALGFALAAAAELGIDSCPMEGFDQGGVAKLLDLPNDKKPLLLLPLGYRAEGEKPRTPEKVRFSKEALFKRMD